MNANPEAINRAVEISGIPGYRGNFKELGGGEVNDTFLLNFDTQQVVLRISRYPETRMLQQEANALRLMNFTRVPKLLFFDDTSRINGSLWILESLVNGQSVRRLSIDQYRSLGDLLAKVHSVRETEPTKIDLWAHFLDACKHFGDEQSLLNHPDGQLHDLIRHGYDYFRQQANLFSNIDKALTHGDATPSNILINDNEVSLIDWEFSRFQDPMLDFSTIYYDDMEYNKGLWRIQIKPDERRALFDGYASAGGILDEKRIQIWMILDKLGAAIYLYWKMHQSGHDIKREQFAQYQHDLNNLIKSLRSSLL